MQFIPDLACVYSKLFSIDGLRSKATSHILVLENIQDVK